MTIYTFLPMLLLALIVGPAFAIAFNKMGRSPAWALLSLLPLGFVILAWMVAVMMRDDRRRPDYEEVFGGDPPRQSIRRG
jgi:DMSO reductase anchor subunit